MINILFELAAINPATGATATLRMSRRQSDDRGAHLNGLYWSPCIIASADGSFSIWSNGQPQPLSTNYGALAIEFHPDFDNLAWPVYDFEGALGTLWVGQVGDPFSAYKKLWTGEVGPLRRENDSRATIDLLGPEATLTGDLLVSNYAGSGEGEGSSDLKGNFKPFAFGALVSVEPLLIDKLYEVYQVNDGPCAITNVFDRAYPISDDGPKVTVTTYAALKDVALEPGEWASAPTLGLFRLGGSPSGKLSADVGATGTVGAFVTALLRRAGVPAALIDAPSMAAANVAYAFYTREQASILETIQKAALEAGRFLVADAEGKWFLAPHVSTKPIGELRSDRSAEPVVLPDRIVHAPATPPAWRVRVAHTRVWNVHNIDSDISEAIALESDLGDLREDVDLVQQDYTGLLNRVNAMSEDGKLDRPEKQRVIDDFRRIGIQRDRLYTNANAVGGVATEYNLMENAYQALRSYLEGLVPAYTDLTQETDIDRTVFRSRFDTFAQTADALETALSVRTGKTALYTNVTGTPTRLNEINAAQGAKVDSVATGADVTRDNTSKDTAAVGGVAAGIVTGKLDTLTQAGFTDTIAPNTPTALAITSTLSGDASAALNFAWSASTASDFAAYVLEINEVGVSFSKTVTTASNSHVEAGLPRNVAFQARVAARDRAGNQSPFSAWATGSTARDTIAPPAPNVGNIVATYNGAAIEWTNASDADLKAVEIWRSTSNNTGAATKIDTRAVVPGGPSKFIASDLASGTTYYYWLKSVDTSANASPFSSVITVTTLSADSIFPPGSNVPKTVSALPATSGYTGTNVVFFQGELWRLVNGAWTKAVDWSSVAGSNRPADNATVGAPSGTLVGNTAATTIETRANDPAGTINAGTVTIDGGKLTADTVTSREVKARTLVANNMVLGTLTGAEIAAESILAENLKAGSVTTPKITVGSLNGDRLTAGTMDANVVKAGTVLSNTVKVANTGFTDSFDIGAGMVAAYNPAARINQQTTTIEPGKILIQGSATLDSWRDQTEINGGAIKTGSIDANRIKANTVLSETIIVGGTTLATQKDAALGSANNSWYCPDTRFYVIAGNKVVKAFNNGWDTSAYTRETFSGSCVVTGRLATEGTFIGITDNRANGNFGLYNYAFHRSGDNLHIYESGNFIGDYGNIANWDLANFAVAVVYDGRSIRYYANTSLLREIGVGPNRTFSGAVGIHNIGGFVDRLAFAQGNDNSLARSDPADRINNNTTTINGGKITAYTIDASRMNVGSLSAISANIGLLRTAASGARTEIENNQIRVYDANNVLRVRIGVW